MVGNIEEKRRPLSNTAHPGKIDRYYTEPGTGLKFRSLPAVQRYLTEGQIDTRTKKLKLGSESTMQCTPRTRSTSSFILPDGWEIEAKPRNNSHIIDKTYIQPGTGQQFRSLVSVERYLTGANEDTPLKALMPANMSSLSPFSGRQKMKILGEIPSQNVVSTSMERNISNENDRSSKLDFGRPPAKVKWILSGPGANMGNTWNPFVDESKTSIEPGTGQRFRSLRAVERYLTGATEDTPLKALTPADKSSLLHGYGDQKMKDLGEILSQKVVSSSPKRNISGENDRSSKLNFGSAPAKVNWVLAGPGENMRNIIMDESKLRSRRKH